MTNPILKKLSNPKLTKSEIADLLEKHIGNGGNEYHCQSAYDALVRIRDTETREFSQVLAILMQDGTNYCETVQRVISTLRGG